jgi:glutathione S-transferase
MWMFAALNTVEPPIVERSMAMIVERQEPWFEQRLAILDRNAHKRLGELSRRLGNTEWLDGDFSAGDLVMANVLLRASAMGLLADYPNLAAYLARNEARPAYQRAFAAQLAVFTSRPSGP